MVTTANHPTHPTLNDLRWLLRDGVLSVTTIRARF